MRWRSTLTAPPADGLCTGCGSVPRSCATAFADRCCTTCRSHTAARGAHPELPGPRVADLIDRVIGNRCDAELHDPHTGSGRCDLVRHSRAHGHALERGMHWIRWNLDRTWVDT